MVLIAVCDKMCDFYITKVRKYMILTSIDLQYFKLHCRIIS